MNRIKMKTTMKYLAITMALALSSSTVLTQQRKEFNEQGIEERSLEILYTDDNTAYALNDEGEFLYMTTDDGRSWVNITEPEDGQIQEILYTEPQIKSGKKAGFDEKGRTTEINQEPVLKDLCRLMILKII